MEPLPVTTMVIMWQLLICVIPPVRMETTCCTLLINIWMHTELMKRILLQKLRQKNMQRLSQRPLSMPVEKITDKTSFSMMLLKGFLLLLFC